MTDDGGLDLLVVEAFTWTPTLETACEVCLRTVAQGRRVGFVFLDIENVDQFPTGFKFAPWIYAVGRKARLNRVREIERILRANGVVVIDAARFADPRRRLSCAELGIDSLEVLRDFRFEGAALGFGTLSSLVRHFGDSAPDFVASRAVTDRLLNSAYQAFVLTRELIEQWHPADVLVYNGRFAIAKAISEAARLCGVGVVYHEIVSTPDRFYLSAHAVHSLRNTRRDLLESWSSAGDGRESVARKYFTPGRGGTPLFEAKFLEYQSRDQVVPTQGRRRIVYFVSSIEEYAAVEDGFEDPLFDSQHSAAQWLASWAGNRPDVEIVIRMHPRTRFLSVRERGWWESLASSNVIVLPAESPVDSYELAASAERVVSYHSSMGAEATYAGAVSILVGDADYRGLDCVYEPASTAELEEMLLGRDLEPKPPENCLPFGYQRLMRGEKYLFYQPISFEEGSFFGQRITPDGEEPPIRRNVVKVLFRLERALRSCHSGTKVPLA